MEGFHNPGQFEHPTFPFPLSPRHQAGLDEAAVSLLTDDQVVQDPEVDGSGCLRQGSGEVLIFRGRLGIPAGVVVDEDDAGGVVGQSLLDDLAGVYHRPVDGSFLEDLVIQDPVLGIQKNDHEGFVGKAGQFHPGEVQDRLGGGEDLPSFDLLRQISAANFFDQADEGG